MRSSVKQFLARFRGEGVRRPELVATRAMGRRRVFHAYDLVDDTFVFEKGVWTDLDAHASVLLARKSDLRHGARGYVMTVTTGNHSVAALPLLQGQFWDLSRIPVLRSRGKNAQEASARKYPSQASFFLRTYERVGYP